MSDLITALLAECRENPPPPNPNPRPLTMDRAELKAAQAKRGLITRWLSDDALDDGEWIGVLDSPCLLLLEDDLYDHEGELKAEYAEPYRRETA